jgi:tetratricopeptide (TPR) repeat protein
MMTTLRKPSPLWNVPSQRNPFFTGRDEVLQSLYQVLQIQDAVALSHPHGISGLGGIGKTQIALEFAYRYGSEYDAVLWVRADSYSALASSFVDLAQVLDLPEQHEQDQRIVIEAVRRWLRLHTGWLLIVDNMDDLSVAGSFLPPAGPGHIVFTTRAQALGGIAQRLEVQKMEPGIGALLLLRRANILPLQATLDIASKDDGSLASEISQELDGLPLALDQAGAYIKEMSCSLLVYLDLYRTRRQELLQTRGSFDTDYPASVATTWSLSFEKVNQINPAAAELLDFCSFLYPDAIPEEILSKGSAHLTPLLQAIAVDPLVLNRAVSTLMRYSLVNRNTLDDTLSMHRLVQTVLKDKMDVESRHIVAGSTIKAVNQVVPDRAPTDWQQYQRYFFSVLACVTLIEEEAMSFSEALRLLYHAGHYLRKSNRLEEALANFERLLQIDSSHIGALNGKGATLRMLFRFEEALVLHEQALLLDPDFIDSYIGKGFALRNLDRFEEALVAFEQAIQLEPDESYSYVGKGFILYSLQRHEEALETFEYVIRVDPSEVEGHVGKGYALRMLKRYEEALATFELAIQLGPSNVDTYNGKGIILSLLGRYEEAVVAHEQTIQLNPLFSNAWQCKGDALMKLGRIKEAQEAYDKARGIGNYEEHIKSS